MESKNLVTVIIPSYNYGHFIRETIESVLSQTHEAIQCLVVDDGSTDNTKDVVEAIVREDQRVRYIIQDNSGPSAARNNGLKAARGRFIQFLDADDVIEEKKLEAQVSYLTEHPETDICYSDARYFPTREPNQRWYTLNEVGKPWLPKIYQSDDALAYFLRINIPITTPLVRKEATDRIGVFDSTFEPLEDWDYWFRAATLGTRFQFIDTPLTLSLIRSHETSLTNARYMRNFKIERRMRKKWSTMLFGKERREQNRRSASHAAGRFAVEAFARKKYFTGTENFIRASILARSWKEKSKWMACIFVAPFLAETDLRQLPWTPISNIVRRRAQ